ncbi:hypothetical protein [Actinoplanes sp. NBRC 103695]|uniref:hypothetical protein n=1 Tax=Actinoplanes sp. NBRC 103695 TaxID=3032202 RepID=UPI0024A00612|nr:hypothetical protein [Actinoplanes sp. NBRC 103695]GLY96491.1 hypothetical protein Acsp02_37460 [Actinoplanes sp. NBRC 103695]
MTDFSAGVERLLKQIAYWEESRWRRPAGDGTRADAVHTLIQTLADLGADAESRPHRPVPRVHDMVLPDQLRVMTDDLLAADPPADALARAEQAVEDTRRLL